MDHPVIANIKRKIAFAKAHDANIPIDFSKCYQEPIEPEERVHPCSIDENHPIIKLAAQIKARQNMYDGFKYLFNENMK